MKTLKFLQRRYKVIAVVFLVLGIGFLAATYVYAQGAVEKEVGQFAQTIINILNGPIGKALAIGCFIGCAMTLLGGRYGLAAACFVAGILLGFAGRLAEAVFK